MYPTKKSIQKVAKAKTDAAKVAKKICNAERTCRKRKDKKKSSY
jgi:hypothetical protein